MIPPEINTRRTSADLDAILARQVGHLRRSLEAYERGVWEEAERLASVVFILVADGQGRTKPLLSQMELRDEIPFLSCRSKTLNYYRLPICGVDLYDGEHVYYPLYILPVSFRHDEKRGTFSDWWGETIYRYSEEVILDRGTFVRSLRSQDGGAHVDAELTEKAYALVRTMGNDSVHILDGKPVTTARANGLPLSEETKRELERPPFRHNPPLPGAYWAAMAHIAWELETTLTEAGLCAPRMHAILPG